MQKSYSNDLDDALAAWRQVIGTEWVSANPAERDARARNITEYVRTVLAILVPGDRKQVREVVAIAARFNIPIYPVGAGKNWGQGSALPARDGCVLVSLERLNRIIDVNERFRYAVIEPGVTQGQLSDHLKSICSPLMLNVTGAARDTSVVGNILERGAGLLGQRSQEMRGVEVLLADGSIVRTGLWHYYTDLTVPHYYAHGLGPDLNGLFAQSNLGVILSMVVNLRPKIDQQVAYLTVPSQALGPIADRLFLLREAGVLHGGPVIINKLDHRLGADPRVSNADNLWLAAATLRADLAANVWKDELEMALKDLPCKVAYYQESEASSNDTPPFVKAMLLGMAGVPTNFSTTAFRASMGAEPKPSVPLDQDLDTPGIACVLPAVPFESSWITKVVSTVKSRSSKLGFSAAFTFVYLNATTLEGFIRIVFDRKNSAAVARAHAWTREVYDDLEECGIFPYRTNIDHMPVVIRPDPFWDAVERIKIALDPQGVISPGRYSR